jgi:hypothetical protein
MAFSGIGFEGGNFDSGFAFSSSAKTTRVVERVPAGHLQDLKPRRDLNDEVLEGREEGVAFQR